MSIAKASSQLAQAVLDSIGRDTAVSQNDARAFRLADSKVRQYLNGDAGVGRSPRDCFDVFNRCLTRESCNVETSTGRNQLGVIGEVSSERGRHNRMPFLKGLRTNSKNIVLIYARWRIGCLGR
jgi:hypothetical protein